MHQKSLSQQLILHLDGEKKNWETGKRQYSIQDFTQWFSKISPNFLLIVVHSL